MNYFWTKEAADTNPFYTYIYKNYYNMDTMNPNSKLNQPQPQQTYDKYNIVYDNQKQNSPYLQEIYKTDQPIISYTKKQYPLYENNLNNNEMNKGYY
jgi:hypothetical protein